MSQPPIKVCVTGAAGNIAYSFIPLLLTGQVFGDRNIHTRPLLRTSLNVKSTIETFHCLESLLRTHLVPQITLNPHQKHKNMLTTLCLKFLKPVENIAETASIIHCVDQKHSSRPVVKTSSHRTVNVLARLYIHLNTVSQICN
jgi:hypothetical protein